VSYTLIPPQLIPKIAEKCGERMPQTVVYLPAGYSLTYEQSVPHRKAIIYCGFQFGGHLADGSKIPGYDFVNDVGLTWEAYYFQKPPLQLVSSGKLYLTDDYLYKKVEYYRVVTDKVQVTVTNKFTQGVFLALTQFVLELPLELVLRAMGLPEETIKRMVVV